MSQAASSNNGQNSFPRIDKWGYYLLPRVHPASPGYGGLLIFIRQLPTHRHFDPEWIHLQLCDNDMAHAATLKLNSFSPGPIRVCPGRVVLHDRVDKQINFFTFGGSLDLFSQSGLCVYWLHSPAPILELSPDSPGVINQFAAEVELMLAVFRAHWQADPCEFTRRLCQLEPLQFYQANLASLLLRYRRAPALKQAYPQLYHLICTERNWLKKIGQWPEPPPTLGIFLGRPVSLSEQA
jgi:hypothetical protein